MAGKFTQTLFFIDSVQHKGNFITSPPGSGKCATFAAIADQLFYLQPSVCHLQYDIIPLSQKPVMMHGPKTKGFLVCPYKAVHVTNRSVF